MGLAPVASPTVDTGLGSGWSDRFRVDSEISILLLPEAVSIITDLSSQSTTSLLFCPLLSYMLLSPSTFPSERTNFCSLSLQSFKVYCTFSSDSSSSLVSRSLSTSLSLLSLLSNKQSISAALNSSSESSFTSFSKANFQLFCLLGAALLFFRILFTGGDFGSLVNAERSLRTSFNR